ncbi:MAG TPA: S8 family peptidase [Acidobacteriota bacterium]
MSVKSLPSPRRLLLLLNFLALLLLVFNITALAAATGDDKLDAALRLMLRGGHLTSLASTKMVRGRETADVVIEAAQDIAPRLRQLGVEVRTVIGKDPVIITADVPLSVVRELTNIPELLGIQASRQLRPTLDKSIPESRINQVWATSFNGIPVRGKGVIVAVVDSGIDWRHGDFKDSQGNTRILEIWDQEAASGTPPQGYAYGNICTQNQINQGQCPEVDTNGHGTHVAGIAAGNGLSTNPAKYVGAAPDADLLIVKSSFGGGKVIDAWNYIINKARALGKPVVINNSFGGHSGPHDGTDPQERAIDQLSGPGAVFVVAAGNEGANAIHAQGVIAAGQSITTTFAFPEPSPQNESAVVVWYKGGDSMSVSLTAPNGQGFGPVSKGQSAQFDGPDSTTISIDGRSSAGNPDSTTFIALQRPSGQKLSGNWSFTIRGDTVVAGGQWDAWLPTGEGAGNGTEGCFTSNVDQRKTVGEPANAIKAVTVASYTTKDCWSSGEGQFCYNPPPMVGAISGFSSIGPTSDGRQKPELAAPGEAVVSARSRDTNPPSTNVDPDGVHVKQQGTSMATPMVAGSIALMLQVNPTLSADAALDILRNTARADTFTGTTWNQRWGKGKLDTKAAVDAVRNAPPLVETLFAQFGNGGNFVSSVTVTNPSRTETATGTLNFYNDQGQPLSVSVNAQPATSSLSFTIKPLGSATFTTDGTGGVVTGSARVSANIRVAGVVRFSFPGLGIAGVGESIPVAALITPVVRDAGRGLNTGVAVSNTQAGEVQLLFSLRGLDGREAAGGSVTLTLPGNGHLARFIDELFRDVNTASFQGTLVITATSPGGKIAATAIQLGSAAGEFTTLPVVAVDPAPATRELYFAQFGNGSGFTSSLFLTDPLGTPASGEVSFFDDGGNPLQISIGGQPASSKVAFNIQPQGGAVFATDGQGALIPGSARVAASTAVGGVLRFGAAGLGIAGVGASTPTSGFITPVTRSVAGGLSTGVAITSIGSPVSLTLTLRTKSGDMVNGGQVSLTLPANGHLARFIQELFPDADTQEFDGTLTVTAQGGNVAGTAIQLGSKPGQFTTLPVTALR